MLGGEIEDEEVEAAQSTELQEGRLQNRGQRDLRAATIAMSQAEKLLTGRESRRGSDRRARAAVACARSVPSRATATSCVRSPAARRSTRARRLTGDVSDRGGLAAITPEVP